VLMLVDVSGAGLLRAGSIEDHLFSRDETLAVLREAQERHLPPAALLLGGGSGLDSVEGLTPQGRAGLTRMGEILGRLWSSSDVATGLAHYVFSLTDLGRRALGDLSAAGRVRAATFARLLALARAFEDQRRAAGTARAHADAGGAHWGEFIDYVRVLSALGREVGATDDMLSVASDGVRVLTVHGSKGLEFPIVYLPNLADGRFPTQRRGQVAPAPPGLSEDETLAARDAAAHLAEEACLFYVAITRARDALVVSYAERYGRRRASPSPFLKPLMPLAADPRSGVARVRWTAVPEITRAIQGAARSPALQDADDSAAPASVGSPQDADAPASPAPAEPEPVISSDEPLRVGAIETYQRCPRQYAYRYVYRLHPREVGLGTLHRSLHETLRELQARVASVASAAGGHTRDDGFPTLTEARELFEQHWREAVAAEAEARRRGETADEDSGHALDGPFGALYRRHGQRVIERAWLDLLRERGLPLPDGVEAPPLWPGDPDGIAGGTSPSADVLPDTEAGVGERRSAPVPLGARLEERVLVRVGGRTIEVTLDRVEGEAPGGERRPGIPRTPVAADAAPRDAQPADAVPVPVPAPIRFVRHRLGRSASTQTTPADLRALLYAMAAEQERRAAPAELYQHNLTTGELERVQLDPRRQARLRDTLIETLAGIESGAYPARPDPLTCQSCPFLLICPA
jgi:UvrD-like helicase C-terminal domain/PD-(D/E)XK nuclease superfamily